MRPAWGDLERPGPAPQVWRRSQHAFHSNVAGPHFEEICRQWARWHAGPQTYGGAYPARVASGTVSDPGARKTAEVDVAVFGRSEGDRDVLLAVATGPYAGEGFDCPPLDTLFLAAPVANKGSLLQYAGRILRPCEGKATAEVHDYHDELTGVLASSLAKRAPGYTSLGFPDPRKLPYTPSASTARPAQAEGPAA